MKFLKGRVGRLSYFLYACVIPVLLYVPSDPELQDLNIPYIISKTMLILLFLYFPFAIWITIKRFHNIGKSGWNTFYLLIPIVDLYFFIVLVCRKSAKEKNRKLELILFFTLILLVLLGVFAAVLLS